MSSSTKRRRSVLLQSWVTPAEAVVVQHKAAATGVSPSASLRSTSMGYRLSKTKIDHEAQPSAYCRSTEREKKKKKGGWGQCWSNVNQVAKEKNMGRIPRLASLELEMNELKERVERDFSEFRTLLMQAVGEERKSLKPGDK